MVEKLAVEVNMVGGKAWLKCSVCGHEDFRLIPGPTQTAEWCSLIIPALDGGDRQIPHNSWPDSLAYLVSFRPVSKTNIGEWHLRKDP